MTWKAYALASAATVLATYVASVPSSFDSAPPGAAPAVPALAEPAREIQDQAVRLETRPAPAIAYEEPARNLFRFGAAPAPPSARRTAPQVSAASVAPADLPPPQPSIGLSGIATRMVDGARVRTAVVTVDGVVRSVREGETIGTGMRVTSIDEDAIEISGPDGATRRLPLRP